jgi:hypothetical protein
VICAIACPAWFPPVGWFSRLETCDLFVYLDDVSIQSGTCESTFDFGKFSVPYIGGDRYMDAMINIKTYRNDLLMKYLQREHCDSPYFSYVWEYLSFHLARKKFTSLAYMLIEMIEWVCGITQVGRMSGRIKSSELKVCGNGTSKIANICKAVGASSYVSCGVVDQTALGMLGIDVKFHKLKDGLPHTSVLSTLLSDGIEQTGRLIRNSGGIVDG